MEKWTIHDESALADIAKSVLASFSKTDRAQFLALRGDLGAGKTAFTKAIARTLGVADDVTSPTFVIMKSYPIPAHPFLRELTHVDAYRIDTEDELRVLGFETLLTHPHRLLVCEWPERISTMVPPDAHHLALSINDDGSRTITYL